MSRVRSLLKYLALAIVVSGIIGCDGVSKHVAKETLAGMPPQSYFFDTVRLGYAENSGSFLSLGESLPKSVRFALFTVGVGFLLALLTVYAFRNRESVAKLFGIAIFVAGGASNWVDRLPDGRVVDFLNVGVGPIRTGVFNVADMAIMAAAAILMLSEYFEIRKQRRGHRRAV
jgi:signal peptidase II